MLMYRRTDELEVIGYSDQALLAVLILESQHLDAFSCLPVELFLEEAQADIDCHFHYGGQVCFLF